MLIGIDWGGTKIEGVALAPTAASSLGSASDTPRHDYHGCMRVDRRADRRARADDRPARQHRHRHPGLARAALAPRQGSQLDLAARPAGRARPARRRWGARSASRTMPTASPPRRRVDGAGAGLQRRVRGHPRQRRRAPASPSAAAPITAPTTAPANGATIRCRSRASAEIPGAALLLRQDMAAWRPGRRGGRSRPTMPGTPSVELKAAEIVGQAARRRPAGPAGLGPLRRPRRARPVGRRQHARPRRAGHGRRHVQHRRAVHATCRRHLAGYTFSPVFETPICKAVHGDSSGVRGAAWLWKDAEPLDTDG